MTVRQLHTWAGLALSLVLLVLGLTGSALVYKDAWWRIVYPEMRAPVVQAGAAHHAGAAAAAVRLYGSELRSVKMPEPGVNAYHLYLVDGEALLSVEKYEVIDRWRTSERLTSVLFDIHAHLVAGESGERVVGAIGLLATLMTVTGLVLWWPARRRMRAAHFAPRELSRRALLLWHRDAGALIAPLLLIVLLTGSGLVFYDPARAILKRVVPGRAAPDATRMQEMGSAVGRLLTPQQFARVQAAFPDARMVFWTPPPAGSDEHSFRLKRPCDVHPNGRSTVHLSAAGMRMFDACAAARSERAAHAMYPLHAGKTSSPLYKAAVFISGLVLAALSATGVATYVARLRGRKRPVRSSRGPGGPIRRARRSSRSHGMVTPDTRG